MSARRSARAGSGSALFPPGSLTRPRAPFGSRLGRCAVAVAIAGASAPVGPAPLLAPRALDAQEVGSGVLIQSFSMSDPEQTGIDRYELLVVPFSATLPIGDEVVATASGAWARGVVTGAGGGEAMLAGLTDTDIRLSWSPRPWLVLRADATIRTGTSQLSLQEGIVAGVTASQLLPTAVKSWGGGSALGGTVALATQVGAWGVGIAGGYLVSESFEPIEDATIGYDPGDLLHVRVAFDRDVGGTSSFSLVFAAQNFADDQVLEANLFQVGTRLQGVASLAFPLANRSSALVFAGAEYRSEGSVLAELLPGVIDTPSQTLLNTGGSARFPLSRRVALLPNVELRLLRTGDGLSQGWLGSGGASLDWRVAGNSTGRSVVLTPSARFMGGSVVVQEGSRSGLLGWEAGLALRVEGPR